MNRNTNARLSRANIAPAQPAAPPPPAPRAPAAPVAEPPQGAPDVGAMIRRVFAHWPVVIVAVAIGGVVTMQVVKMRKPLYKSETVITYREGIGKQITGSTEGGDGLRTLGTKLKETLLAQQTLRRIIDEFHLYPDVVQKVGYAEAVDQMRKKTEFKSRSQDTFAISYEGVDKDVAQKVCARMADLLVSENAKRQQEENKGTTEFLEVEKKRADEELDRVERDISEFIQRHPEFANSKDGLGTESLALQKKASDDAKRRQSKKSSGGGRGSRRAQATAPGAPPPPPGANDDATAVDPFLITARNQARTELSNARKDLNDKSLKFTDQHPDVRAAQARVDAAEANLQKAEDAIANAQPAAPPPSRKPVVIDDPYGDGDPHKAPAAGPSASPDEDKDKEDRHPVKAADPDQDGKVVSIEMEWTRLLRTLGLARTRQAELEQKLYKAEMVAGTIDSGYGSTIAVLDPAYKPSGPSNAPNKTVMMIGLAASIAVGLVLSAAWGLFLDDRLFSPNEIESIVMVPVLGVVPRSSDDKKKKKKGKGKDAPKPGGDGRGWGVSRG